MVCNQRSYRVPIDVFNELATLRKGLVSFVNQPEVVISVKGGVAEVKSKTEGVEVRIEDLDNS